MLHVCVRGLSFCLGEPFCSERDTKRAQLFTFAVLHATKSLQILWSSLLKTWALRINQVQPSGFSFVLKGWKSAKSFSSDILSWPQQSHSEQNGSSKLKDCEHSTNVMKHVKHVLIATATDDINRTTYMVVSLATKWLTHGFQCSGSPTRYKYNVSWLSSGTIQLYNELISYTKQFSAIEPKNYFI